LNAAETSPVEFRPSIRASRASVAESFCHGMTIPEISAVETFLVRTLGAAELSAEFEGADEPRLLGPGKPLALLAYCCCARDRELSP
jgi:hypothetical protein